jgi:hypothetical protein
MHIPGIVHRLPRGLLKVSTNQGTGALTDNIAQLDFILHILLLPKLGDRHEYPDTYI